jgi:quercetin dioxygenase-like cupin family protein
MRLFELEAGGRSPFHSHPWDEVFILEGEGLAASEEKEIKFKAGDVIFLPPNEKHQLKNNGEKAVKFLCIILCK